MSNKNKANEIRFKSIKVLFWLVMGFFMVQSLISMLYINKQASEFTKAMRIQNEQREARDARRTEQFSDYCYNIKEFNDCFGSKLHVNNLSVDENNIAEIYVTVDTTTFDINNNNEIVYSGLEPDNLRERYEGAINGEDYFMEASFYGYDSREFSFNDEEYYNQIVNETSVVDEVIRDAEEQLTATGDYKDIEENKYNNFAGYQFYLDKDTYKYGRTLPTVMDYNTVRDYILVVDLNRVDVLSVYFSYEKGGKEITDYMLLKLQDFK